MLNAKFPYYRAATASTLRELHSDYLDVDIKQGVPCDLHGVQCGIQMINKWTKGDDQKSRLVHCSKYYETGSQFKVFRCAKSPFFHTEPEPPEIQKGYEYCDSWMLQWYTKWMKFNGLLENRTNGVLWVRRRWQGHVIRIFLKGPPQVRVTTKVKFKYFVFR